jgi:D-xylulose reductase
MEPLAVAVHSVAKLGKFQASQTIAIFGCGPVGLLCMAVAKALGAQRIIAVDIVPSRLTFAKLYVATDTFKPPTPEDGESKLEFSRRSADQMKEQLGIQDRGARAIDLVVDASGVEVSIQTALAIVKFGGIHVQVRKSLPKRRL